MFLVLLCLPAAGSWALNWEPAAIAGEDADGDGIRDDVAGFIQQHWQAEDLRHWASEAARASQSYLTSGGNRFALQRAHAFMERSRRCLTQAHGPQLANTVINRVLRIQLDSYERQQRYKEAVDQWVHKVSREGLPARPDDDWNPACGPEHAPAPQTAGIPQAQGTADNDELPPPNFFITRAMPRDPDNTGEATSASVKVRPLPSVPLPDTGGATNSDAATPPVTGSWTTYTPRPRGTQQPPVVQSSRGLPVRRLRAGESAAMARREPAPAAVRPARPVPPALRELAPFIQDVQQR